MIKRKYTKYTNKDLQKIALSYNHKIDFQKGNSGAYNTALKRKILNKICKHMTPLGDLYKRFVYQFIFKDNSRYVGITYNFNRRYKEHLTGVLKENSLNYILISKLLPVQQALDLEENLINYYLNKKIKLHNKGVRHNLGSMTIKWTKENCHKEALKYKTRREWQQNSGSSYSASIRNNWSDYCTSHMSKLNTWSKENCLKDALKYKTRYEWQKNNVSAYLTASKKGWLEFCTSHMLPSKTAQIWSKNKCILDAKKYKTRSEWCKNSTIAYQFAQRHGFIDDCCLHMPNPIKNVLNLDTGEIFKSIKEASISINRDPSSLSVAIRDGRKCAGTYWSILK